MKYFLMTVKKVITLVAEEDQDAQNQAIDHFDSLGVEPDEWDFELDELQFPEAKPVIH